MQASVALAIFTFCLSCLFSIDASSQPTHGFSVDLIHRDSPMSPFHKPQETSSQRFANALRRSIGRVRHFNLETDTKKNTTVEAEIFNVQGEYLIKMALGTPPFEILAIADTGSDLIWTQCQPCDQCYTQDAPIFNPKSSSTYREVPCSSRQCKSLSGNKCSSYNLCQYTYGYGDGSYTNGYFASETITLGSTSGRPLSFPRYLFGCGHNNAGTFGSQGSGLVGLGGGSISLISQLGSSISGKFSYCLMPLASTKANLSSKLNFGINAVVSGRGVLSTPLIRNIGYETFYFLKLEAISVGSKRVEFPGSTISGTGKGNIIIDSGTTLTLVPQNFYEELASEVKSAIRARPVEDPSFHGGLCYKDESDLNIPVLTAHFSGADVQLKPVNTFMKASEDVVCFAFASIREGAIFGYVAQLNFLVGYDIQKNTVSFKPTDCSRH